ncbi:MAG: hypothetical protein P8178_12940 [Candidatus Thiodiazotropha sp.]
MNRWIKSAGNRLRHWLIGLLLILPLAASPVWAADSESGDTPAELSADEVAVLRQSLDEMQRMAPKLRVMLRTLRTQVGIDTRQVYTIENSIGQPQKDLERLVAMHQRGAVNRMRAHFLTDDIRRKAEALQSALAYVVRREHALDSTTGDKQKVEAVREDNQALIGMLGDYGKLLEKDLALLQSKAF